MSTGATRNYLGIYQDILENYSDDEMYNRLVQLDEIAETCLTFAEFKDYHKQSTEYLKRIIGENDQC